MSNIVILLSALILIITRPLDPPKINFHIIKQRKENSVAVAVYFIRPYS